MGRKLLLITISKPMFVFQNLPSSFTCDATWQSKRRYVTSGLPKKSLKITNNSETVRDGTKVTINHYEQTDDSLSESGIIFNLRCHLAEKTAFCHFRFTKKSLITQKRYEMERKLLLITNSKPMFAFQNLPSSFTYDSTWRSKRHYVTSGISRNH